MLIFEVKLTTFLASFHIGILMHQYGIRKDALYQLLKASTFNWCRLLLCLCRKLFAVFNRLTSEDRNTMLIVDDSAYDRSISKRVELLSPYLGPQQRSLSEGFSNAHSLLVWLRQLHAAGFFTALFQWCQQAIMLKPKTIGQKLLRKSAAKEATIKATAHLEFMI